MDSHRALAAHGLAGLRSRRNTDALSRFAGSCRHGTEHRVGQGRACTRGETLMSDGRAIETEATELLRTLIRNKWVKDGTVGLGQETRNGAAVGDDFAGAVVS